MRVKFVQIQETPIAEIISDGVLIESTQDALDRMMDYIYQGSNAIIIHEKNIISTFFELSNGIAGDVLQNSLLRESNWLL